MVANVATPFASVPVPMVLAPSINATEPVAVLGLTVAVNVTLCPKADGFKDEVTAMLLEALFTVCVSAEETLEPNDEFPG